MLEGKIDTLGDDLVKQWTYLQWPQHLAVFPVWNPETGSMLTELDAFAMKFAFWRTFVQWFRTPFLRRTLINWINECINIDNLNDLFKARYSSPARTKRLGLALGSADVLRGKIKIFREDDLSLAALLACGSLDEMGGVTTIVAPPHDGTYLDGAWGDNPPINELLDYALDEIWLIQCFRKTMPMVPQTPAARTERKHELWQNSLVEHELEFVSFVNKWASYINEKIIEEIEKRQTKWETLPKGADLADLKETEHLRLPGKSPTDTEVREYLRRHCMVDGKLADDLSCLFDEENDLNPKYYTNVKVKKIEIGMPRELGSSSINAPWFIRNLMCLGYEQALQFADNEFEDKPLSELRPAHWGEIPSPYNYVLYGMKQPSLPKPKPFMKGPIGDALELACDFCPRKAVSTAGELFLDVLPRRCRVP